MLLKKAMYDTALAEFESKRDKALATARIYMENPVGIGEHPQFIEEMDKQLDKMASAEEKLTTLFIIHSLFLASQFQEKPVNLDYVIYF